MKPSSIAGIILAAGSGTRMGNIKQLLPFRGRPMLASVVSSALDAALDPVIVVLGHAADTIRRQIRFQKAKVVYNSNYQLGQSSSLQAGLAAVPDHCAAAMFLLGDQPLVTRSIISSLADAYRRQPSVIVVPEFKGRRGHPVIIDRHLFPQIKDLTGDTGARSLIQSNRARTLRVAMESDAIHFDVDRPEDYARLKSLENSGPVASSASPPGSNEPCN